MVLSSTFRNPMTFARMASVEELDSSLTLLTHHTTKLRKNSVKAAAEIDTFNTVDDNSKNEQHILTALKQNTVPVTVSTATAVDIPISATAALLTPPGTPYSMRTISPETTVEQTFNCFSSPILTTTTNSEATHLASASIDSRFVLFIVAKHVRLD